MITQKPIIVAALEANSALTAHLGIDAFGEIPIYQFVAKDGEKFDRITFFELSNIDIDYADDGAISSELGYQIDVWSLGSTTFVAAQVDLTMKSLNYKRMSATDLYEPDTKIYHKAMRYEALVPL